MKILTAIAIFIVIGICFGLALPVEATIGYSIIATLFYMQLETIKERLEK
jgi:hypothetical protein